MKALSQYINEYLIKKKLDKVHKIHNYEPKTLNELHNIIANKIEEMKDEKSEILNLTDIDVSNLNSLKYMLRQSVSNYLNSHTYSDVIIKKVNVTGWDVSNVENMENVFGTNNSKIYDIVGLETWDVSNVTTMRNMFRHVINFNGNGLENWNTSKVEDMCTMFADNENFDGKSIENWDVSKVENMSHMFFGCMNKFNPDLSAWDVSNVANMSSMFKYCDTFEGKGLEKWNTKELNNIICMFESCHSLKADLSNWNVSELVWAERAFYQCVKWDCDLSKWNVSKLDSMQEMFSVCKNFKGKGLDKWKPKAKSKAAMRKMFDFSGFITKWPSWYKE